MPDEHPFNPLKVAAGFPEYVTETPWALIDFYADWCEPCKTLDEVLREVDERMNGKILIHKVNVDHQPELVRRFQIQSVPVLMLLKRGTEVWRMNGFMFAGELLKIIEQHQKGQKKGDDYSSPAPPLGLEPRTP